MGRATLLVGVILQHVLFTHESFVDINADNSAAYTECATSYRKARFFGKMQNRVKREKLLQFVFPVFTWDEPFRRYALYVLNNKRLRRCCHVDKTEEGRCVSIVSCGTRFSFTTASPCSGNISHLLSRKRGNIAVTFY